MSIPYFCAECGRELTGWNEDEARREFEKIWPNTPVEICEKICVECFEMLFEDICQ